MVSVCFYFQVHQPYRLKHYQIFDIGKNHDYFDTQKNSSILQRVIKKCYLPMNKLLLELLDKHPEFRVSFSFSGVLLDQLEEFYPETLDSFKELVSTKRVEILDETYHHSLAFIYSKNEFKRQILLHNKRIKSIFKVSPKIFRNTELIYNNELAYMVEKLGYKGVLSEGADKILGWRSPNFVYRAVGTDKLRVLLKNYRLSDDIAFRFSNRNWPGFPLTAEKYASWISNIKEDVVNLFMDYETFGEHQWPETGIFDFMKKLPEELLNKNVDFKTPSEVIRKFKPVGYFDSHSFISWADIERDLSAWLGNQLQQSTIKELYVLEDKILKTKDKKLIEDWRRLQTSDHFYYMCIKWFSDGDVHKYFNPYNTPYDAFITFMNVLNDLNYRADEILKRQEGSQVKKQVKASS